MIIHLVIAGLAAATSAALADPISRRLAPSTATRLLTAVAVATGLVTTWVLLDLAVGGLGLFPEVVHPLGWCRSVAGRSHDVPAVDAALAAAVLYFAGVRSGGAVRRWRALDRAPGRDGLAVVPAVEPFAYAVPGRPGHIVVSQGMLRILDRDERRAMLAHEQAHLDLRHHRYLRGCAIAAHLPLLAPVARATRHATERWADEVAAGAVGDRPLVARAVSRAALASADAAPAGRPAGLLGGGVAERVAGLLEDPPPRFDLRQGVLLAATVGGVAVTGALTLRMHDVAAVLVSVFESG